jgi:hypothetical protein
MLNDIDTTDTAMDEQVAAQRGRLSLASPSRGLALQMSSVEVRLVMTYWEPCLFYPAAMRQVWVVQDDHKR